jgi:tRNA threonylcarbamoyladenosine biosynthesis protein TsaB
VALLAIDTSTRISSVALYGAAGVQAETTWQTRANHTVELVPQILRTLDLARVDKASLSALGIALGPGSFTGLRVGMSVAKGLAFALNIPILGIPSLDAVASVYVFHALPIYAILAAGRSRYSIAPYAVQSGIAVRVGNYALVDANGLIEIARKTEPRSLFCGEIDAALARGILQELGERVLISSPAMNSRRAGYLAELAWARFQRGESDDTASIAPMYTPHETL